MWMTLWRLSLSFLFITSRIFSSTRAWWWNLQNYRLHVKILENIFVFHMNGKGLWYLFYTFQQLVFSKKELIQENQSLKSFDFFSDVSYISCSPRRVKMENPVHSSSEFCFCNLQVFVVCITKVVISPDRTWVVADNYDPLWGRTGKITPWGGDFYHAKSGSLQFGRRLTCKMISE